MRSIRTCFSLVYAFTAFGSAFARIPRWAFNGIFPTVACTSSGMTFLIGIIITSYFINGAVECFAAFAVERWGITIFTIKDTFTINTRILSIFNIACISNATAVIDIIVDAFAFVFIQMLADFAWVAQRCDRTEVFDTACRITAAVVLTANGIFTICCHTGHVLRIAGLRTVAAQSPIAKTIRLTWITNTGRCFASAGIWIIHTACVTSARILAAIGFVAIRIAIIASLKRTFAVNTLTFGMRNMAFVAAAAAVEYI